MSLTNGLKLIGKNKNSKKFGPKGHARSMKKGSKNKKIKIKFQNSKKVPKTFLSSLQVQCRLRFGIWTSRLCVRASQSYPYYMKSKKCFFTITQKVLLWGAWNCNSRLQSLKVPHGPIFIKKKSEIWGCQVVDWFVVECPTYPIPTRRRFNNCEWLASSGSIHRPTLPIIQQKPKKKRKFGVPTYMREWCMILFFCANIPCKLITLHITTAQWVFTPNIKT